MSKITIADLEVFYCVGVSDEERAKPQRLLITVDMAFDFSSAAIADRITKTIDYAEVSKKLLEFGHERNWKLLERLVTEIADMILSDFQPAAVNVQVKKFAIPQASYVAVSLTRNRSGTGMLKRAGWGIP